MALDFGLKSGYLDDVLGHPKICVQRRASSNFSKLLGSCCVTKFGLAGINFAPMDSKRKKRRGTTAGVTTWAAVCRVKDSALMGVLRSWWRILATIEDGEWPMLPSLATFWWRVWT